MIKTISYISQMLLKAVIFGILPFFFFILITSRTPVIGGIQSFTVLSGSMEPTVPVGSIIFTQKFPSYRINDVIAFKRNNIVVTHRIVDIEDKNNILYYKTKGDANNTVDTDLVSNFDILGKSFYYVPYLGRFVFFMKTIPGFLIFIVFPALIYIILEIFNIKNEMTKEIEKKLQQKMQKAV